MDDYKFYMVAMDKGIDGLEKNKTQDLIPLCNDQNKFGCKLVLKKKIGFDGIVEKYKTRLVGKWIFLI